MNTDKPWVLVRVGRPQVRFGDRAAAMQFFARIRDNAGSPVDAAIYGPNGEKWTCSREKFAAWERAEAVLPLETPQ